MKIVVLNGSPKGKSSSTNIMASAFLKGAQEAGAETINIFLAEKEVKHCRGCFCCWFKTPGKCVIKDDMAEVISLLEGVDVLVLATPLYFDNISGILKNFMDRSIVVGNPHFQKDANGECRHLKNEEKPSPKLILMSNCGFPERSHFQVVSHWVKRAALNMHTEVIGEIYTTQGGLLSAEIEALKPITSNYLQHLEKAGKEIVAEMKISAETEQVLAQNFIPDEIYIQESNAWMTEMLSAIK